MGSEVVILPFFCGLLFFVVFFAYLIVVRWIEYRETLKLAEKGLLKSASEKPGNGTSTLRWGIIISSIGLALLLGLWPIGFSAGYLLGIAPWMIGAFLPLFFGLGLILLYVLTKDAVRNEKEEEPKDSPPEIQ